MQLVKKHPFFGPSLWEDFFSPEMSPSNWKIQYQTRVDVKDDGQKVTVHAEVPGFEKDEIKVELDQGVLTLKGSKKEETEEKTEKGYLHREIRTGSFSRAFRIDRPVKDEALKATLKDGILTVELPYQEERKSQLIPINA